MPQNGYFIASRHRRDSPGASPPAMRPRFAAPIALFTLLAGLSASPPAAAWGRPGHRVVAHLAEAQLRPAARAEAERLLAAEPAPRLAGVSGWADDERKAGGADARRSRRWHFVNFRDGNCEYAPARDCANGDCVVAAINREFLRLADRRLDDAARAQALKFLVHFVADVHQPLHATPIADRGGQDFQVAWHGKGRNLHTVWDALLIDRALRVAGLDEAGYARALALRAPPPADPTRHSDRIAADWAQESCRVVRDEALYPPTHVLGDDYLDAQRTRAELRLRLAGSRLANMLNFALDPRQP